MIVDEEADIRLSEPTGATERRKDSTRVGARSRPVDIDPRRTAISPYP
jgi:hypothetical protein